MVYSLIADAGSTKIEWALVEVADSFVKPLQTTGLNALTSSPTEIEGVMCELLSKCPADAEFDSVHYYGAGCATPEVCMRLADLIGDKLDCAHVEVHSDLTGAAKSLLGNSNGVACILGTGSNSCLYDGRKIVAHTPSLGYVAGDEGSGNAIGRRLVSDYFKRQMPESVSLQFSSLPAADLDTALLNIYKRPGASRWLASLAMFAAEHRHEQYIIDLVKDEFNRFIERNVSHYFTLTDRKDTPVCFTGGVAAGFSDILTQTCEEHGLCLGTITRRPIDGLVRHWLMMKDGIV